MNENSIKEKIKQAMNIVEGIAEEFKVAAFNAVLGYLLNNEIQDKQKTSAPKREEELGFSEIEDLSLREFVHLTGAKNLTENTAAIAFYLLKCSTIRSFNYKQIIEEFNKAMFVKPTNIQDILNKMIKRRLLEKTELVNDLKGYKLTKTGVNFVEKLLAGSKNN